MLKYPNEPQFLPSEVKLALKNGHEKRVVFISGQDPPKELRFFLQEKIKKFDSQRKSARSRRWFNIYHLLLEKQL